MTLWSEQISSLYKIRSVSDLPEQELSRQTVLRGEHFSYQIILRADYNVFCRFSARVFGPDGAENEALTAALRLYRLRDELDLRLRVCQQPFGPVHTKTIYILGCI